MKNLVNFDKKPANFAKLPRTHEHRENTTKPPIITRYFVHGAINAMDTQRTVKIVTYE